MDTKKLITGALTVFVLFVIITQPKRAAEMVGIGFQGISDAASGIGEFMTELVR
ncbi:MULTISPECIES: hypothetical protein [unclassified Streptomyces]|uniref:hypothetical protein n=1 Tax=unclassified Streptomyces TaxID=2593676 RepID=UPI001BE576D9|nr:MULTISPECIES: hypothetical protein [unclassified Streptomyces]WSZ41179.1 hypothetical protein OG239_21800 [Streptomyces sp. NBC_00868]MBT2478599.1 hypothetical protein [Streptomyces sp. ISL-94]MBT2543483.1 hypothetical protein [Streptomyces sp. ISL-44]MCX5012751.1 hypothetical protein [Streptomyces sp. NBC_00555]MCX5606727.1 hypothetical protein [Streptomyces sp. NBC_00047]